jgi:putative transposase
MDFLTDRLADGRRFRVLTLVDHVSRVSPAVALDVSISGERVAAVLNAAAHVSGLPQRICVDNGPEFISRALDA